MLVLTKQREVFTNIPHIVVYLGVDRLTQLSCLDYLGVKLDAHLTWNAQIDAVCKKTCFYHFQTKSFEECFCNAYINIYLPKYSSTSSRLCNHNMGICLLAEYIKGATITE